jgi:2-keto-3-deoxy-L-rhamnonate aldolase RhmA
MQNPLRQKFQSREPAYGFWVSLESPSLTEIAATMGIDWVCIDLEHGHLDYKELVDHLRAVRGTETAVLVRVPELQVTMIKRALDLGAHGVIVPNIQSAEEAQHAVQYAKYPPQGVRGIGGERAVRWGLLSADYLATANAETLVIPLIESREAVESIDSILEVDGVEAIYLGLSDMSASYGYPGQWEAPGIPEIVQTLLTKTAQKGVAAGILARTPEETLQRTDEGFSFVCLGSDTSLLIRALREYRAALGLPTEPHY